MTREQFSAAVAKMRAVKGVRVDVTDWPSPGPHRNPYRYATVTVCTNPDMSQPVLAALAALAMDIGGYLTMHTYEHHESVTISVAVHRDLDAEETRALMLSPVRERESEPVALSQEAK